MALLLPLMEISSIPASKPYYSQFSHTARRRNSAARVCVYAKVKEEEKENKTGRVIRVSDPIREPGLEPLFAGPLLRGDCESSSPPSVSTVERIKRAEGGDDKRDYYVNMGYAIRTLREEFPDIFFKEPNFDIYREDIVFRDPFNTFVGIENYKRIFRALRFAGPVLFKTLWIDIVSIWQPAENIVMIRWIVHGVPRVPWDSHGRFDGTSEYKLDKNGKIYEHKVDNIALNSPTKFRVLPMEELVRLIGCPSTPRPTYFRVGSVLPVLSRSAVWIRWLVAVYLALTLVYVAKG